MKNERIDYRGSLFFACQINGLPDGKTWGIPDPFPPNQEGEFVGCRCFSRLGHLLLIVAIPEDVFRMNSPRFLAAYGFLAIPKLEAFSLIEVVDINPLIKEYQESK